MTLSLLAAHHCFYRLGPAWMKTFTSLYKVPVRAGDSLFTLLHESIKLLLPMLEEQEQLRILSTRVKLKEQMEDDVAWGGA